MGEPRKILLLDGGDWFLVTDPDDIGRNDDWPAKVQPHAVSTKVPWIIQEQFPGYEGAAWFWKAFEAPDRLYRDGRFLLKFWEIDFKAMVYLNGLYVGDHICRESAFTLDVTDTIRPGERNLLAVRVITPGSEPVDGIIFQNTPHGWRQLNKKTEDITAGSGLTYGGIIDSVELMDAPAVRIDDLYVRPDPHTGVISADLTVYNGASGKQNAVLSWSVSDREGRGVAEKRVLQVTQPGKNVISAALQVDNPCLWELDDPCLYTVAVRLTVDDYPESVDTCDVRTGFRDFRFADGFFRLNGKRIFVKGTHTINNYPGGLRFSRDVGLYRKDLIDLKAMGFNMVRFIGGIPVRIQLELADELGLMVHEESTTVGFRANERSDNPDFKTWFDTILKGMILRDRNHPSIVLWGILNEIRGGFTYANAAAALQTVRALDTTRMVLLNSGGNVFNGSRRVDMVPADIPFLVKGIDSWDSFVSCNTAKTPRTVLYAQWLPQSVILSSKATARWIAPKTGLIQLSAEFWGSEPGNVRFRVHIRRNEDSLLLDELQGTGSCVRFQSELEVKAGDTLDFLVARTRSRQGISARELIDPDVVALRASATLDGKVDDCVAGFMLAAGGDETNWRWGYTSIKDRVPDGRSFTALTWLDHGRHQREYVEAHSLGCFSNPHSDSWDVVGVDDIHRYLEGPPQPSSIDFLRRVGDPSLTRSEYNSGRPIYLSEYGVGSGVDLPRVVRLYLQNGFRGAPDQMFYEWQLRQFMVDYERWHMQRTFGRPEEFFQQSLASMAALRTAGLQALRSNPRIVGHNVTGGNDQVLTGEGLTTTFREHKPGIFDAMRAAWSKLLWSAFVEPINIYDGDEVLLEAVLSNEDVIGPGEYPAGVWIFDERNQVVFSDSFTVTIRGGEPFAIPAYKRTVEMRVDPGPYRLVADFMPDTAAAAAGGERVFRVFDRRMVEVSDTVLLWGHDPAVEKWLAGAGIACRPFDSAPDGAPAAILALRQAPQPAPAAFADLVARIERGSRVFFLSSDVFGDAQASTSLLPLQQKGSLRVLRNYLYHPDYWNARDPAFAGMPAGSLMDWGYFRELLAGVESFVDVQPPDDVLAAAIDVSRDYASGLLLARYRRGAGRFIINTLRIAEYLGRTPQAELLLRNILNSLMGRNDASR